MIATEGLGYGYDGSDAPVVEDVTLSAEPGEVLGIIGPSGTGKTTLLRQLALFDPPDRGRITARVDPGEGRTAGSGDGRTAGDGRTTGNRRDVWSLPEGQRLAVRQRIGMVFQNRSLFSTSVRHNAAYGLAVRRSWTERARRWLAGLVGGGGADVDPAVRDALETVGLGGDLDRPARSLSAGEAQRVAFARALATDPDLLLLDEPTSNLDPRNTAVIEEAVADARDRGIAVVIATHDMRQARRVADRTAVLLQGTILEQGPTERVFGDPEDERTRQFVEGELVY